MNRVILLILLTAITVLWSKEPCLYCHKGEQYTTVFDSSAHGKKGVSCYDCHVNLPENNLYAFLTKYFYIFTFSYKNAHIADKPATETCISCHRGINKFNVIAEDALPEKLQSIGMVVEHKKHFELRDSCFTCHSADKYKENEYLKNVSLSDPMGCTSCHKEVAHGKPTKHEVNFPLEKNCANCHHKDNKCPKLKKISDVKDKGRCTECHPNQYSF